MRTSRLLGAVCLLIPSAAFCSSIDTAYHLYDQYQNLTSVNNYNVSDSTSNSAVTGFTITKSGVAATSTVTLFTDYGLNRAYASATAFASDWTAVASAQSAWIDNWTITGGTGTGQMSVYIHLSGTITGDGQSFLYSFAAGLPDYVEIRVDNSNFTSGNTYSANYTFTYGVPFEVDSYLYATAAGSQFFNDTSASGTVDFHSTAIISAITLPQGATLTAESGASYPPSAVPLPAALWFFSSGLLGVIGVARRRNAT